MSSLVTQIDGFPVSLPSMQQGMGRKGKRKARVSGVRRAIPRHRIAPAMGCTSCTRRRVPLNEHRARLLRGTNRPSRCGSLLSSPAGSRETTAGRCRTTPWWRRARPCTTGDSAADAEADPLPAANVQDSDDRAGRPLAGVPGAHGPTRTGRRRCATWTATRVRKGGDRGGFPSPWHRLKKTGSEAKAAK